ncbi:MAG: amino acid--tRNA ligase-related protein, partial [Ardenticatenaceae bacterium]
VEDCWAFVARELNGITLLRFGDHQLDLAPPWRRTTMQEALLQRTGIDIYQASTLEALQTEIAARGLRIDRKPTWGKQVDELFSETVEPHLIQPTLVMDYPYELSPFAKRKPDNPNIVERFEFFIGGMEIANAFTELNDPLEQLERFEEQQRAAEAGDAEAQPIDLDYINALMYGMPPTGGIGWGIDRMAMIFTGQRTIREVILFPQLRASDGS